jgi:hypothetical protein
MIFVASMKLPGQPVHEEQWNGAWQAALLMHEMDIHLFEAVDSDASLEVWERVELPFLCAPVERGLPMPFSDT